MNEEKEGSVALVQHPVVRVAHYVTTLEEHKGDEYLVTTMCTPHLWHVQMKMCNQIAGKIFGKRLVAVQDMRMRGTSIENPGPIVLRVCERPSRSKRKKFAQRLESHIAFRRLMAS